MDSKILVKMKIKIFVILLILQFNNVQSSTSSHKMLYKDLSNKYCTNITSINDTLQLLQCGEKYIDLGHKDVILILGNTGSGKTTLTQFLAGDSDKLVSKETKPGTGDYIIEDQEDKIGYGIYSKTLIPEKVTDPDGIVYYDCPGFSDTRSSALDIASTYFIKRVIDQAKTIKIVFTVSYPSVRIGVDRTDFMKLLKHATNLIKDSDKYNKSIALVVTKVDNEYAKIGKEIVFIEDDKVISKVVEFLLDVKSSLTSTNSKDKFHLNAIKLIDILVQNNGFDRIALFRRPDEAGVLSKIKLLQKGKTIINNVVAKNLVFSKKTSNDFGYTVSETTIIDVNKLYDQISREITSDVDNTVQYFLEYYQNRIKEYKYIYLIKNNLERDYKTLYDTVKQLNSLMTFKEFLVNFIKFGNEKDIKNSRYLLDNFFKKHEYIEFLQTVSNQTFKLRLLEWTKPLNKVLSLLEDSNIWYTFLSDLYHKMSSSKTLSHVRSYMTNTDITSTNIDSFFKEFQQYDILQYNNAKNISKDTNMIAYLNYALKMTTENMTLSCIAPDRLIVKGDFVKFSDFIQLNQCPYKIKSIVIFALNSVYIDEDLIKIGEEMQIFLIAPRWEILGTRKIILDGSIGKSQPKAQIGQKGKPGLPGGSSGSFNGYGYTFVNAELLTIHANGGKGGPGQDGGDGYAGADGKLTLSPDATRSEFLSNHRNKEISFKVVDTNPGFISGSVSPYFKYRLYTIDIYDIKGETGKDGHEAGLGGKGGSPGSITVYTLGPKPNMLLSATNGPEGLPGKGGHGGPGGRIMTYRVTYSSQFQLWVEYNIKWTIVKAIPTDDRVKSGNANKKINEIGRLNAEPAKIITLPVFQSRVNDYKMYLLENLNNYFQKQDLEYFYFNLTDNKIQNNYDLIGLLGELRNLENKFFKLNPELDLLPFYTSLLDRIHLYSDDLRSYEKGNDHKKVLSYLYTAVLSRINSLSNITTDFLIIDIEKYFKLVLSNIKDVQVSYDKIVKYEYNVNYKNQIDDEIADINYLVSQISPDIQDIDQKMNNDMELLVNETVSLQEEAEKMKDELLKAKQKLRENAIIHTKFGVIKIMGSLLSLFPEVGTAASQFISQTSGLVESLAINPVSAEIEFHLPPGIKRFMEESDFVVSNWYISKTNALDHFLLSTKNEIAHYSEFKDLETQINDIRSNLTIMVQHKDKSGVTSLQVNLQQILKAQMSKVDGKALNVISKLSKIANVLEQFSTIYLKYKDDQKKLAEISNAIEEAQNNIDTLQKFEKFIPETLTPLLNSIREDIGEYEKALSTNSHARLDVSRWRIRSFIKNMKRLLQTFTEGLKVHDDLLSLSDKLGDIMDTLINIYDRLQNYKDQKLLADYIEDISSSKSIGIEVHNKTLNEALVKLNYGIKSNVVLDQYKKAMNAFKLFVFPFANYYLHEYSLPKSFQIENQLENLVSGAVVQLNGLLSKIIEKNVMIENNIDEYVQEDNFEGGDKYNDPFFVWDNEKYGGIISKLLDGKEIILKADIMRSVHRKNSVKFNKIGLNFKSVNVSVKNLEQFDIQMIHSGNSYYRCDNKFYRIKTHSQRFDFSLANDNGEPLRTNEVYKKIYRGNYMLSPYTTWSIKLVNFKGTSFASLSNLKGKVDLELIGHGQYVGSDSDVCTKNLKEYYKMDDTLSVTNNINIDVV